LSRKGSVDFVIGSHRRHGVSLTESRLKRLEHDSAQLALSYMDRRGIGATLRRAMSGKMLGLSDHGVICMQAFALRTAHIGKPQLPGQVRIFAEILFDTPPARLTSEIEDGSKNHSNSRRAGLSCNGGTRLLCNLRIPGGREVDGSRKNRSCIKTVQGLLDE
jgi:hypothetical protein